MLQDFNISSRLNFLKFESLSSSSDLMSLFSMS